MIISIKKKKIAKIANVCAIDLVLKNCSVAINNAISDEKKKIALLSKLEKKVASLQAGSARLPTTGAK